MHVSRKMLAVLIGITLAVSIPLQCTAQTTNENTDFSMISSGKTLSENILVKGDTDNIVYGDSESQYISEEAYKKENDNEIKSFATHTHTVDCFAGHRHVANNCVYAGKLYANIWVNEAKHTINADYENVKITISCYDCGEIFYKVNCTKLLNPSYNYTTYFCEYTSVSSSGTPVTASYSGSQPNGELVNRMFSSIILFYDKLPKNASRANPYQWSFGNIPIIDNSGNLYYAPYAGCPFEVFVTGPQVQNTITSTYNGFYGGRYNYSWQMTHSDTSCRGPLATMSYAEGSPYISDYIFSEINYGQSILTARGRTSTITKRFPYFLTSPGDKPSPGPDWTLVVIKNTSDSGGYLVNEYRKNNPEYSAAYDAYRNHDFAWFGYNPKYSCPTCLFRNILPKTVEIGYSCGLAQDETPICNQVVTSITAINPVQTIKQGETISSTATATYLDGHTSIINCTSNLNQNLEGTRIVTLTYTGLINNAKTTGTKTCNITVTVDNNPPVIIDAPPFSTVNSIRLNVSAADTVSLAANAYKYTIGTGSGAEFKALVNTGWLSSSSHKFETLTPNTAYTYIVQVMDNVGYISTPYERSTYTYAVEPIATVTPLENNRIKIVISDSNPANTLYSVKVGDQYSNNSGVLSSTWSEFTLSTKQLEIAGLKGGMNYKITVSAKEIGTCLPKSREISITTAPDKPTNLSAGAVSNSNINLTWESAQEALEYEVQCDILSTDGTVIGSKPIVTTVNKSYKDSGLIASQNYRYSVRCKDQLSQYSTWSDSLTVMTLPMPPEKVSAEIAGKILNISWASVQGAVGYEVEFVSDGTPKNIHVTGTSCTIEADKYDSQCVIKVRAYNMRSESDPSNSDKWSNAGVWSDEYLCYTCANIPLLKDVQVTTNSATVTWESNDNPNSVRYLLGIFIMDSLMKEVTLTDENTQDDKLTCTATELLPNTEYLFKIKAKYSDNQETSWSEGITRKTLEEVPDVPDGLLISSSGSRISLAWNMSERASSYEVRRNDVVIATGLIDHNYVDKEVVADQEYAYEICAVNDTGSSEWSATITTKLGVKPVAPQVTVVTGSSISVSLEWTPIEDSTGYDIEVDNVKYTTIPGTTYEHTGLKPGEEHTYRVRSRNSIGYSAWSEPVTAMTIPVTPGIPYNISAVPSNNQLIIRWEPVLDVTSYDVEIDSQVYYDIQASEYLYTIMDGEPGASICKIRVRAVNKGYISEWSEEIEAIDSGGSEIPVIHIPTTPSITSCTTGASSVCISWDKIDGASKYQLEADGVILYTGTNTTFVHRGLKEMTQYHYRVRAGNISGFSEWSSPFETTTTASNNTTPKNLTYYREDSTSTAIVWEGNSSVGSYRIEVNAVLIDEELTSTKTSIPTIPDKQYKVRVVALIKDGENIAYDWSDEMIFNAPSNLPGIPTINGKTATSDKITISWNEVIGANGYDIDIDGQIINVNNKLTYTITNLNATTSYTIKVRAYNTSGKGSWSETSAIITNESIPTGAPINITIEPVVAASVASGCAISINWNAVEGATSYEVEDQNGTINASNTDEIIIGNLQPGLRYYFKVRALTSAGPGPWSSRISFVPVLTVPENIKIKLENDMVHMSWNGVGGAKTYEIEIDGVVLTTTANTTADFAYKTFYAQRPVRVRACNDALKSEWSEVIFYNQPLPKTINVTNNEEISVILPVKNVNMNKYKFTLTFDSEELELLDAYEMTPKAEKETTYLKELGVYIIRSNVDNLVSMTFVVEDGKKINWSGIVSSIRFRSKKTGNVTLKYGVTLK
jgi:hypothetical protein